MLNENFNYYNELEKYIVAGEMAIEELDNDLLPQFKAKAESGDQMDLTNYQELLNIKDMLVQRVYDLRISENISLQTIPMLRSMQHNNYGLIRKINSAFIVTLPVFKQCLSQAILIKKQELQTKSLQALDDKTNELLLKMHKCISSEYSNCQDGKFKFYSNRDVRKNAQHYKKRYRRNYENRASK